MTYGYFTDNRRCASRAEERLVNIEYVSENRAFTDADDYSLEIELPLTECPQNIAVIGHLTRKDIDTDKIFMMRHRLFAVFLCKDVPKCADLAGFGRVVAGCIK